MFGCELPQLSKRTGTDRNLIASRAQVDIYRVGRIDHEADFPSTGQRPGEDALGRCRFQTLKIFLGYCDNTTKSRVGALVG